MGRTGAVCACFVALVLGGLTLSASTGPVAEVPGSPAPGVVISNETDVCADSLVPLVAVLTNGATGGTYTWETNTGPGVVTFYPGSATPPPDGDAKDVGVDMPGTYTVKVTYQTPGGLIDSDISAPMNFISVNIVGHQPGTMASPGGEVPEYDEDEPENLPVPVNNDNDDGGPVWHEDCSDEEIGSTDDDIVKVTLKQLDPPLSEGTMTLTVSCPTDVQIYKSSTELLGDYVVDLAAPAGDLAPLASGDMDIWLEGTNRNEDLVLWLSYGSAAGSVGCRDGLHLCMTDVDLDLDSDHTHDYDGWPTAADNRDEEDGIEADPPPGHPGLKYVVVNDFHEAGETNGVPGYADFDMDDPYAPSNVEVFVEIELSIPEPFDDPDDAKVVFTYHDSDPSSVTVTNDGEHTVYIPESGVENHIRLWLADQPYARSPAPVPSGDFIKPGDELSAADLGFTALPGSKLFYVEAVTNVPYLAECEIGVEVWDTDSPDSVYEDLLLCTPIRTDVDVDSDNDNGFDPPEEDLGEDHYEDIASCSNRPGKILGVNDNDDDGDGLPDFIDGYDGLEEMFGVTTNIDDITTNEHFVPVVFKIPEPIDLSAAKVRLKYSCSNPLGCTTNADGQYLPAPGHLRIWTADGDQERDGHSFVNTADPGDYVPTGTYSAVEFGFTGGVREVLYYLEGISNSADVASDDSRIIFTVDPDGDTASPPDFIAVDAVRTTIIKVDLDCDIDNDGDIDDDDDPLEDDTTHRGDEYLFVNDALSNGLWDKDDPDKPTGHTDDDDVQKVEVECTPAVGAVWFDHPAISKLAFYKTRACLAADEVTFPIDLGGGATLPSPLYIRAEGTFTSEAAGDLKFRCGPLDMSEVWCEDTIRLTIVKQFGDSKFFHAARDYVYENNTKMFVHERDYGTRVFRLVCMCEELTTMVSLDTYDHLMDEGDLEGIDEVVSAYPLVDVVINGNQCFHRLGAIALMTIYHMTDTCHGRFVVGGSIEYPPSSDDVGKSPLAGPEAAYIGFNSDPAKPRFVVSGGVVPNGADLPFAAMGGLSTYYASPLRTGNEHQMAGLWGGVESGKGVVFTATETTGGGGCPAFQSDAKSSGIAALPNMAPGQTDRQQLVIFDSGSSVGLAHADPSGTVNTIFKLSKHWGWKYYINTYLSFMCDKPR